jgi:hypothetical protein
MVDLVDDYFSAYALDIMDKQNIIIYKTFDHGIEQLFFEK